MSHFTVLVVTEDGSEEQMTTELKPYHEFECTGLDDEYVQDIDITGMARRDHAKHGNGAPFKEFCLDFFGYEPVHHGFEPDTTGAHKYGYVMLDEKGDIAKVVQRTNPNAKWDWWVLGGRWAGQLLHKNGSRMNTLRKGDLDIEALEQKAIDHARSKYRLVHEKIIQGEQPITFEKMKEKIGGDDYDAVKEAYWAQPAMARFSELPSDERPGFFFDPQEYAISEEEYVDNARIEAFSTHALLMNGNWSERGEMGMFATMTNEDENWGSIFRQVFATIPDDAFISVVDCHV